MPESTQVGYCVFLSDPAQEPKSKFREKPHPETLFIFSSSRSLRGFHIRHFLSENIAKFRLHQWLPEYE